MYCPLYDLGDNGSFLDRTHGTARDCSFSIDNRDDVGRRDSKNM